jgi:hypothetical protein
MPVTSCGFTSGINEAVWPTLARAPSALNATSPLHCCPSHSRFCHCGVYLAVTANSTLACGLHSCIFRRSDSLDSFSCGDPHQRWLCCVSGPPYFRNVTFLPCCPVEMSGGSGRTREPLASIQESGSPPEWRDTRTIASFRWVATAIARADSAVSIAVRWLGPWKAFVIYRSSDLWSRRG